MGAVPEGASAVQAGAPLNASAQISPVGVPSEPRDPPYTTIRLRGASKIAVCETRGPGGVPEGAIAVHAGAPARSSAQMSPRKVPAS